MSDAQQSIVIPDRQAFKAAEVCELLKVQPYVLRTWEQEFKELGVAKSPDGPRVYRRRDVELAVRIRQLVFGDGLTLAGARRRLEGERPETPPEADLAEALENPPTTVAPSRRGFDEEVKTRLRGVRDDLRALLAELSSSDSSAGTPSVAVGGRSSSAPAPATAAEIREFTLEPVEVEPHLGEDHEVVTPIDSAKGKRTRRGNR